MGSTAAPSTGLRRCCPLRSDWVHVRRSRFGRSLPLPAEDCPWDANEDDVVDAFDNDIYDFDGSIRPMQGLAMINRLSCCLLMLVGLSWSGFVAQAAEETPPFPGARSEWQGFARYDFSIEGKGAIVVVPKTAAPGKPWLWRGEFFGHRPEPDVALLGRGFHVVYLSVPNLFGSPDAISHWDKFYSYLTEQHGFAKKAALVGVSRGGLYCYNWAAAHPDRVACIYGDAPVCDLKSWPLGQNNGDGNPGEVPKLLKVYGVATVEELLPKMLNPIDNLGPIAAAKIPLLHVYGDADKPVPWDKNTGVLAERYRKLGGEIVLIPKPGVGHVHGLDDCTPIVEFVAKYASPKPE